MSISISISISFISLDLSDSFVTASVSTLRSEEIKESKKSFTIASGAAKDLVTELRQTSSALGDLTRLIRTRNTFACASFDSPSLNQLIFQPTNQPPQPAQPTQKKTGTAWNKGFGDAEKVESTDEYITKVNTGIKAVVLSEEVKSASNKAAKSAVSLAVELLRGSRVAVSALGTQLSESEKWSETIRKTRESLSLLGASVYVSAKKWIATLNSSQRELPYNP